MLNKVELTKFKSFRAVELACGGLTLIVGANAAGKSNVRDGLRFLHGVGLGYTLTEVLGGKYGAGGIQQWRGVRGGPREVAHGGASDFRLSVEVTVEDGTVLYYYLGVDVSDERLGPRVVYEALKTDQHYLFDSAPDDDPVQQRGEHQLRIRQPRGGRYRAHGKISEFPSNTPILSQLPHRTKEPASLRHHCERVLSVLRTLRFLDLDPEAMRESSPPGHVVLGDRGENLSSVLLQICSDDSRKAQLLSWVRSLTPMDATDFVFRSDLQGRVLVYLVEGNGFETSAVSASDGTLRFLALVAALLSPDSGRIYFFEEFDNGIHPTRLHLLLDLVQQACDMEGVQVIGTTHNPALLAFLERDVRDHAVLAFRDEGAPDTRLIRIADLTNVERILETQDLGKLHATGWLEDAAAFAVGEG